MLENTDLVTSGGTGGIIGGIIAFVHKFLADRKIERLADRINDGELFVARNYVTQDAMKSAIAPVVAQLIRMENKIDGLTDGKVDK